jgi:hypothetical protein
MRRGQLARWIVFGTLALAAASAVAEERAPTEVLVVNTQDGSVLP